MACSTHLLSQSLYPLNRANPAAARGHLRFQASPSVRLGSGTSRRRALGLRVAASAEQGRRQVEVSCRRVRPHITCLDWEGLIS